MGNLRVLGDARRTRMGGTAIPRRRGCGAGRREPDDRMNDPKRPTLETTDFRNERFRATESQFSLFGSLDSDPR